jgi:hypothetical protein
MNECVGQSIEEKIVRASGFDKARNRQLRRLKSGLMIGTKGRRPAGREALHER